MKKLLLLALMGLGLGAGVWKSQNPTGTVEDLRVQALAVVERLKTGVAAVRAASPQAMQDQQAKAQSLEERLVELEALVQSQEDQDASADIDALVSTTDARFAANDEQQSTLKQALESLQSTSEATQVAVNNVTAGNDADIIRLDAIDSRLELLVRRLDEQPYDSDISALTSQMDAQKNEIQQIVEATQQTNNSTDNSIADVNELTTALGLRMDTLVTATAQVAAEAANATETDSNTGNTTGANNSNYSSTLAALSAGLDERFTALEERLQTVNSDSRRINALNEQLNTVRSNVVEFAEQTEKTNQSIEALNSAIEELKTAGESLSIDTVQAEIRDQLALVQSQFASDAASDNTQALENLLDNTRDRIQTLEQRVQDLPAASTEADNAQQIQSALQSQIVALERRLEGINSADPALASTLSNVQEKVDLLASREYVTLDDLRAQNETQAIQYKIYFDRNSAEITGDASTVLSSFITQEKNRTTGVSIFGFTDRRGSAIYNQQLALQRATNVRSYLIQNGLDYTRIKALTSLGEDAAAAVLPDNADDAQQRMVVIYAAQP